ncbi:MAG: DNA repair protein RadC [Clostridiales bacterium]|nr:DNA repair protein RadC [Clostridiales bacterium]
MDTQQGPQAPGYLGHRDRLRERFLKAGLEGFAPHEALELLLTYAIPRRDVKPLARALIHHFGSFNRVLEASHQDLQAVRGIGPHAASLLCLLLPLLRLYRQGQSEEGISLSDPQRLLAHCQGLLMGERVERFYVLALDARGRLITSTRVSSGDDGETAVYPRLVAAELLRVGAAACVLAHNHPSGLAQPSKADIQLTRALRDILAPLSIQLRDHVLIAGDSAFSFLQQGLIT